MADECFLVLDKNGDIDRFLTKPFCGSVEVETIQQ